jgi:hypothetical protein
MEAHRGPRVSIIPRANVTLVGPRGSVRGRVERSSLIHPGKATGYVPLILVRSIAHASGAFPGNFSCLLLTLAFLWCAMACGMSLKRC